MYAVSGGRAKNPFLKAPITEASIQKFKVTCRDAILKAEIEFKEHRGFWYQIHPVLKGILGLIALFTVFPALIVAATAKHGFTNTFFATPSTQSFENLQSFKSSLEGQDGVFSLN